MNKIDNTTIYKKYESVHALRGLAALFVMFFHFRWTLNSAHLGLGNNLFGKGGLGVDLFFIISGFVVTLSSEKLSSGIQGCITFLKHRAKRILPVYYFWLLMFFLFSGAMSTFHYPEKTQNLISALTFTTYAPSLAPAYIDLDHMYNIRWTLNYEVFFYLAMTLSLLFKRKTLSLCVILIFAMLALPMMLGFKPTINPAGIGSDFSYLNLISNPIILLFLMGVFFAKSLKFLKVLPVFLSRILLLTSILAFICLLLDPKYNNHGLLSSGIPFSILFLGCILNEDLFQKYTPTLLRKLGDISFSLYIIHTIMNVALDNHVEKWGLPEGWTKFILFSTVSIILAYVSYNNLEMKSKFKLSRQKKMTASES